MNLDGLDPVIHAPKRLATMALLVSSTSATFAFVRDQLELSDSDLSKQMSALERAGYVSVHKSGRGPGSITTYRVTAAGEAAYRRHLTALRRLIDAPSTIS